MKTGQRLIIVTLALWVMTLWSTAANADPVTLTLTNRSHSGKVGNILALAGSVSNVEVPPVQIVSSHVAAATIERPSVTVVPSSTSIPEPATLLLMGSGLFVLAAYSRRYKRTPATAAIRKTAADEGT